MGGPRLTWLKMLLEPTSMPSEYLRSICFLTIFEGLAAALESVLLSVPAPSGRVPLVGSAGLVVQVKSGELTRICDSVTPFWRFCRSRLVEAKRV